MRLIGLFIAIALAAAAALVTMKFTGGKGDSDQSRVVNPVVVKEEVPVVNILVAKTDLPIGTQIKQEDLDIQPWPAHLKLDEFIPSEGENKVNLVGMVTRTPFKAHEPMILSRLANPNDPSFLAASLPKGMRAVTIATDAIAGVGGFVYPGDHVDVLLTHEVPRSNLTEEDRRKNVKPTEQVTEVFLTDVRVLAVNQKSTSGGGEEPTVPSNVSISVSQKDAERLRLAERNGTLSLALRSLEDKNDTSRVRPVGVGDLSRITPPSYYPVLYDITTDYTPKIIDVFGKPAEQADATEGEESDETLELSPAMFDMGSATKDITVIRGTQKETVGVDRP